MLQSDLERTRAQGSAESHEVQSALWCPAFPKTFNRISQDEKAKRDRDRTKISNLNDEIGRLKQSVRLSSLLVY